MSKLSRSSSQISIQAERFDMNVEVGKLRANNNHIGAVVTFSGYVRDFYPDNRKGADTCLKSLTLEHYPGMVEKEITEIIQQSESRWALEGVRVIHRVGELKLAEPIVLVAVASAHRKEAFAACEFIMDFLKTRAPFWKKETKQDGDSEWVDARESDQKQLKKWDTNGKQEA